MDELNLRGLGVAIVTPMNDDSSVDYDSLERLITYQIENGVDYLVTLGTTGEAVTLTADERVEVIRSTVEIVAGRCPLIAGMGDNYTDRLVQRLRLTDTTGLDAILSVVPFYNKPTQEGIYRHFYAVAEASPLPVVLYNIPSRTGVNMLPDTVLRLVKTCPKVVALKEAGGQVEPVREICSRVERPFCVLSGDDHLSIDFIQAGAQGVISVAGNAYPRTLHTLIHLALEGKCMEARAIGQQFDELCEQLFVHGNPAGIKSLLRIKGLIDSDALRLPLVAVPQAVADRIAEIEGRMGYIS